MLKYLHYETFIVVGVGVFRTNVTHSLRFQMPFLILKLQTVSCDIDALSFIHF